MGQRGLSAGAAGGRRGRRAARRALFHVSRRRGLLRCDSRPRPPCAVHTRGECRSPARAVSQVGRGRDTAARTAAASWPSMPNTTPHGSRFFACIFAFVEPIGRGRNLSAASTGASWTCPACSRRVPGHVSQCRCGRVRRDSDTGAGDTPTQSHGVFLVKMAAAVVVAAAATVGAVWYSRSAPAAAGLDGPDSKTERCPAPSNRGQGRRRGHIDRCPLRTPRRTPRLPAPHQLLHRRHRHRHRRRRRCRRHLDRCLSKISSPPSAPALSLSRPRPAAAAASSCGPTPSSPTRTLQASDLLVRVRRASGDTTTARVETVARDLDLAVLRLSSPPADQPLASLGTSSSVRSGQEVVAIGSALGVLQNTVTRGIVSGVRQAGSVTLIQTDAAINPGNSGGPLVDREGNVIGINTMGVASAQGISFAVAVDHVRELLGGQHTTTTFATPASSLNQTLNGRMASDTDSAARARHDRLRAGRRSARPESGRAGRLLAAFQVDLLQRPGRRGLRPRVVRAVRLAQHARVGPGGLRQRVHRRPAAGERGSRRRRRRRRGRADGRTSTPAPGATS